MQAKFLHVLDNKEITRLGGTQPVKVNVRIIAAATPELHRALQAGRFRLDLYHRLCVLEITVPPLRDRDDDVIKLAEAFLAREGLAAGSEPPLLSDAARHFLRRHDWPGNIRELRNLCIRWLLTVGGRWVTEADLPAPLEHGASKDKSLDDKRSHARDMRSVADDLIRRTLIETAGNISEASRRLGIDRSTIYRRRRRWQASDS